MKQFTLHFAVFQYESTKEQKGIGGTLKVRRNGRRICEMRSKQLKFPTRVKFTFTTLN